MKLICCVVQRCKDEWTPEYEFRFAKVGYKIELNNMLTNFRLTLLG